MADWRDARTSPSCPSWRQTFVSVLALSSDVTRRVTSVYTRQEMELALPDNPELIKADGVATKALPKQWNQFIGSLQRWNFSWTYSREALSTIVLVFEAKLDNLSTVLRQLQMGLFSAQSQRRALCMKNGPVFGVILNNGYLSICVSLWKDDQLVCLIFVKPHHVYLLLWRL